MEEGLSHLESQDMNKCLLSKSFLEGSLILVTPQELTDLLVFTLRSVWIAFLCWPSTLRYYFLIPT